MSNDLAVFMCDASEFKANLINNEDDQGSAAQVVDVTPYDSDYFAADLEDLLDSGVLNEKEQKFIEFLVDVHTGTMGLFQDDDALCDEFGCTVLMNVEAVANLLASLKDLSIDDLSEKVNAMEDGSDLAEYPAKEYFAAYLEILNNAKAKGSGIAALLVA